MLLEKTDTGLFRKLSFAKNPEIVEKIKDQLPEVEVFVMNNPTDGTEASSFRMNVTLRVGSIDSKLDYLLDEVVGVASQGTKLYLYEILGSGLITNATGHAETFLFRGKFE